MENYFEFNYAELKCCLLISFRFLQSNFIFCIFIRKFQVNLLFFVDYPFRFVSPQHLKFETKRKNRCRVNKNFCAQKTTAKMDTGATNKSASIRKYCNTGFCSNIRSDSWNQQQRRQWKSPKKEAKSLQTADKHPKWKELTLFALNCSI